jgi:hypothetical protein
MICPIKSGPAQGCHVRDARERSQRNGGIGDRELRNCPLYLLAPQERKTGGRAGGRLRAAGPGGARVERVERVGQ